MHLSRILTFGHDTTLLQTREMILRKDGQEVLTATAVDEATRILTEQPIDLLILCHTLRQQERESILSLAHTLQRGVKALVLTSTSSGYIATGLDATLCTNDGPPALLATVHQLTSHLVH